MPTGWVAALEEEGSVSSDHVTGEDSEFEVEAVCGLNVHLAQAMSPLPAGRATMFRVWVTGPFHPRLPPL